jgi:hypothetical protein
MSVLADNDMFYEKPRHHYVQTMFSVLLMKEKKPESLETLMKKLTFK